MSRKPKFKPVINQVKLSNILPNRPCCVVCLPIDKDAQLLLKKNEREPIQYL